MAERDRPEGLVYRSDLLTVEEEADLLERFATLRFDAIVFHGQPAQRTARHYGLDYDYQARTPMPGEPVPEWIEPTRARAAAFAGVGPDELAEILVQHYPPGAPMGWHYDAPAFDIVVGISLGGSARMRFQRGKGAERRTAELVLNPRSGYILSGEARWKWQHSIPAVKETRYSITFRTLRTRR